VNGVYGAYSGVRDHARDDHAPRLCVGPFDVWRVWFGAIKAL